MPNGGFAGIGGTGAIGIAPASAKVAAELGSTSGSLALRADGTLLRDGVVKAHHTLSLRDNSVVMVALDLDKGIIWFGIDGKWLSDFKFAPPKGFAPLSS